MNGIQIFSCITKMDEHTCPRVTNMVVAFSLPFEIDLNQLINIYPQTDYRPKRFNGAIIKTKINCLLVFRNGKINVVGNKRIEDAEDAVDELCLKLQKKKEYTRRIVNIVATCALSHPIVLNDLANNGDFEYNPEIYPAAYYNIGKAKISVFHTGKIIFTGFSDFTDIVNAFDEVHLLIKMV